MQAERHTKPWEAAPGLEKALDGAAPLLARLVEHLAQRVAELVVQRLEPSLAHSDPDDRLLDVKEAAAHLRLRPSTLYKLSSTGQITKLESLTWYQCTRHSFASHWVADGRPIERLREILGHSTVKVTERYAHLRPDLFSEEDTSRR